MGPGSPAALQMQDMDNAVREYCNHFGGVGQGNLHRSLAPHTNPEQATDMAEVLAAFELLDACRWTVSFRGCSSICDRTAPYARSNPQVKAQARGQA